MRAGELRAGELRAGELRADGHSRWADQIFGTVVAMALARSISG